MCASCLPVFLSSRFQMTQHMCSVPSGGARGEIRPRTACGACMHGMRASSPPLHSACPDVDKRPPAPQAAGGRGASHPPMAWHAVEGCRGCLPGASRGCSKARQGKPRAQASQLRSVLQPQAATHQPCMHADHAPPAPAKRVGRVLLWIHTPAAQHCRSGKGLGKRTPPSPEAEQAFHATSITCTHFRPALRCAVSSTQRGSKLHRYAGGCVPGSACRAPKGRPYERRLHAGSVPAGGHGTPSRVPQPVPAPSCKGGGQRGVENTHGGRGTSRFISIPIPTNMGTGR